MFEETLGAGGILELMQTSGALLDGHFELSSGLHSGKYIQCALLLEDPPRAERVGQSLSRLLREQTGTGLPEVVVSPALGGIVIGHEVAKTLGTRFIFTERVGGSMTLRRGFKIDTGEKVFIVEDVVTTGGSTKEVIDAVTALGGEVTAIGSIVNRGGNIEFSVPFAYLLRAEIDNYAPANCPLCKDGIPVAKPGSTDGKEENK